MLRWQRVAVLLSLLCLAALLPTPTCGQAVNNDTRLTFVPRTANASWSGRADSNIEFYNKPLFLNATTQWPAGVMILQGKGDGTAAQRSNDVWASSDLGATWHLIAGRTAAGVNAPNGRALTSFTPLSLPATGMDHNSRIWRIGGRAANGAFSNDVWMSSNGGLSWTNQASAQGARRFDPPRSRAGLMFDSRDSLYLLGGMYNAAENMTRSIFVSRSPSLGIVWNEPTNSSRDTPWEGRGSGLFFNFRANARAQIEFGPSNPNREVLIYTTGWNGRGGAGLSNEVWISSDYTTSWSRVRSNWGSGLAPFRARDAANGEVTAGGVLVIVGGQADDAQGFEQLNDVWVSLDGGYSWGQCAEDATFDDRRDAMTVLDDQGYLYVGGGANWATGALFNDFWRSSFSFDNLTAVTAACNVRVPACGTGLTCWPGDPRTTFYSNGTVTCPASRACAGLDPNAYLDFEPQTEAADWSKRWAANAETFPRPITWRRAGTGVTQTAPANSLVMYGGQNQGNDVWLSTDKGVRWDLIAGVVAFGGGSAYGTAAQNSFNPPLSESTGIVDARYGALYRIGGYGPNGESNDVWRSTNAITWTKQAATNLPPRSGANVVVDDRGKLYVVGGIANNQPLMDIWASENNGTTFYRPNLVQTAPFFKPRRGKGFLLHRYSWQLQKDILFYGAGWDGSLLYNDVWVSSDQAVTWTVISTAAPFEPRDAAFAEITASGLIVLGGGQTGPWTQNDVWVSPDGGFTWSVCGSENLWPDRRDAAAVFDSDEYLLILGGRENTGANAPQYNDVYRSTFSLNNLSAVAQACSINIPWCGTGLSCWPGADGTVVYDGGVSCQWTRWCEGNATGGWRPPSSTGGNRPPTSRSSTNRGPRPFDPCRDMDPVPADCDNYEGSTGGGVVKPAGLTTWAIGGIIVLVVAVVGGLMFFFWRRSRNAKAASSSEGKLDQHLFATTDSSTTDL